MFLISDIVPEAWNFPRAIPLLCLTVVVVCSVTCSQVAQVDVVLRGRDFIRLEVRGRLKSLLERRAVRRSCYGLAAAAMLAYSIVINTGHPENLVSLAGLVILVVFCWIISYDRRNAHGCLGVVQVSLRPVVWGLAAQMALGAVVLKTKEGREGFAWLGRQVEIFLDYVIAGVVFVFGDNYKDFFFALKLMPTVIFISSVISVLYYVGIMQKIVNVIAMTMKVTMGTTAAETVVTAASIFLGQPEASLTIRPYLSKMSRSELHAIMTAGFASVSADIFALFVNYGVSSAHILTAVLMSAPAGLAVSKIVYPEVRGGKLTRAEEIEEEENTTNKSQDSQEAQNILDAAARGAQDAVAIIFAVGATLIAFLSILEFLNAVLKYLGSLVNIENLTFELALSYVLMPLAFVMGVPWKDCRVVGEVIGLKTVLNELVGYQRLGEHISNNALSRKSQVIAVYALCGFSNPTTVGVTLGGLGALIPSRRQDLASLVISAWVAGCVACFMTACFAAKLTVVHNDGADDDDGGGGGGGGGGGE
ncbi:hypothetical protein C0Q70_07091 [Pomacea canaliculata]|uniref:Sodium/nucleoside cotransporter n=1 Tax=Pomacea canaliculata TaxID=400727 RepID=A0A2T7PE23_POMCA|nr:hypothetical protein C0Q70_07091 [Pomacea canaliculata]